MEPPYARFVRSSLSKTERDELRKVDEVAAELLVHLKDSADDISLIHVYRAKSTAVQAIVSKLLRERLGFGEEVVLSPTDGLVTSARPDFFYCLSPGRGILAEVERGGTTTNNHDLKDMWKTHIAPDAHHLFLVVPVANWNEAGVAREKPFTRVSRRLAAFFGEARREVDVVSLHLFGYGGETLPAGQSFDSFSRGSKTPK